MNDIGLFDERPEVRTTEADAAYDTVDNDGKCQSVKVSTLVLYNNVRTDDDRSTYNTLNMDTEHVAEHVYKSLETTQSSNRLLY